jgi:hypothetical protein
MAEYSRIARGSFVSTASTQAVYLPFAPDTVKIWNYSSIATPAQHGIPEAYWSSQMGQGYAAVKLFNATPVLTTDVVTANGISTFAAGQLLQLGPRISVTATTKSDPISITTATPAFNNGDVVVFEGLLQTSTTGMTQICGMPFTVLNSSGSTFGIAWDGSGSKFTALTTPLAGAYVRKVLHPFLYEPGVKFIGALSFGTTTQVITTSDHCFVAGQIIGFRIPPVYGTVELNAFPNSLIPGQARYYYVTQVIDNITFVCNAVSTGFTTFNPNQPIESVPGLDFPQVFAVGDVNTGGLPYSGGDLYPSPVFPTAKGTSSIGGPAIAGAFVNNTYQGFSIGIGSASKDESSKLVGSLNDVIYYEAMLMDMTS